MRRHLRRAIRCYSPAAASGRESLLASSSGTANEPIVLLPPMAKGAKPKFLGSDVLRSADFQPVAKDVWKIAASLHIGGVLADHQFLLAAGGPSGSRYENRTRGFATRRRKHYSFILRLTRATDQRIYTACVRVDPAHSNFKDYLVFSRSDRRRIGRPSATATASACRGSKGGAAGELRSLPAPAGIISGAIDSTDFVGVGLHAAYAMPNIPGGATFYVSFSDPKNFGQTHRWIDCSAEHLGKPRQSQLPGVLLPRRRTRADFRLRNMQSHGGMLSLSTSEKAPVTIRGGLIEDASLEIFGDGVPRRWPAACAATRQSTNTAPTACSRMLCSIGSSRSTAARPATVRRSCCANGAKLNMIRCSTIVLDPAADDNNTCLAFVGKKLTDEMRLAMSS